MKSTGIVRPVDKLGRIVIPNEIRETFGIAPKDALEIYTEDDKIILKRYEPACVFCGSADDILLYAGKKICGACLKKLADLH